MMWALVINGTVSEITSLDPAGRFHPSLTWAVCDASVHQGALATLSGSGWTFAAPPPPPSTPPSTQISPLTFIARFTAAEQSAIATAAMANAPLWLWFQKMTAATYIDLADAETKAGLDALVSAGLITAARETAILAVSA